jgi:hypothetical protein
MKKIYFSFFVFALLALVSCAVNYAQLYETQPLSTTKNKGHIFENDTLRVDYSFWSENGTFSFSIFNKLNVPIYLDWKKSSFIKNNDKLNYWNDIVFTESIGFANSSSTVYDNTLFSTAVGFSSSLTSKPEQITFIPPQSAIYKVKFQLKDSPARKFSAKYKTIDTASTFQSGLMTHIKYKAYDETSTPLVFRNFMTFSTSDKFDKEFFVDNGFYLAKITELDRKQLAGTNKWLVVDLMKDSTPFKSQSNYYARIAF